jgi:hypothetical protein
MAAGAFVALAPTGSSGETPSRAATRAAGAQVGAAIGLLAVFAAAIPALVGGSFEAWATVSVPAGVVAGAAVAPGILTDRRPSGGRIGAAAFLAFLVGDLIVCGWISLEAAGPNDWSALTVVLNTIAAAGWGVVFVGWFALLILSPVAAVGAFVLRERTRRVGGAARWP